MQPRIKNLIQKINNSSGLCLLAGPQFIGKTTIMDNCSKEILINGSNYNYTLDLLNRYESKNVIIATSNVSIFRQLKNNISFSHIFTQELKWTDIEIDNMAKDFNCINSPLVNKAKVCCSPHLLLMFRNGERLDVEKVSAITKYYIQTWEQFS